MSKRKSHKQFLQEVETLSNGNIRILGEYSSRKTKISVQCCQCGRIWEMYPDSILRGSGCRKCSGMMKKTTEDFITDLRKINPEIIVCGEYKGNHQHIEIQCKKCQHKWTAMPSNLLRNYGCPICNGGIKYSEDYFLKLMKDNQPDTITLGNYQGALRKVQFKCLRCGHVWSAQASGVMNGKTGCPACAHSQTSFIEQIILIMCENVFGKDNVFSRDHSLIGSELDIVVDRSKAMFAIEPGSWTLHKDKLDNDLKKIEKCKEKKIDLLIIYDQNKEKLVETNNIWSYTKSFNRANDSEVKYLLKRIADRFCFEYDESNYSVWKEEAYNRSRRMSTEEFRKRLQLVNPNVILLGEYNGNNKKTKFHCKKCHYEWETRPLVVMNLKSGCPRCSNVPRKNSEYFRVEMANINPHIIIKSEYVNAKTKVLVKCAICGYEWSATPDKLHSGRGCPACAEKKRALFRQRRVKNVDTGEVYSSITVARKITGISSISACCRGVIKTAGGFHWEYC